MEITTVKFKNFKAFREFNLRLGQMNVLVGPNNAGKSTIIGAFRVLNSALRRARTKAPTGLELRGERRLGYQLGPDDVPVSLENAHTDYADDDSTVEFGLSDGEALLLTCSANRVCRCS